MELRKFARPSTLDRQQHLTATLTQVVDIVPCSLLIGLKLSWEDLCQRLERASRVRDTQ